MVISASRRAAGLVRPVAAPMAAPARAGLPFAVFCVYLFVVIGRPQDYWPALAPFRLALVFTILTSLVTLSRRGERAGGVFKYTETKLYFLLFAVMCAGIPFSIYRRASFDFVILQYVANMAFYVMFVIHVNSLVKYRRIIVVLVISALTFTIFGLLQGRFNSGRFTTGSQVFDSNDVAFIEVSFLPFAMCAILGPFSLLTRALALTGMLLSILLALYTGSRGGLIALGTILLLFLILRTASITRGHKAAILLFVAIMGMMSLGKLNVKRYSSLADLGDDYNTSDEEGRVQIWNRGWQLLLENPLTGVGVNGFGAAIGTMRASEHLRPVWQAPHNSYVQVFTETGFVGGASFVLLIATCLRTLNGLRRGKESPVGKGLRTLPGLLFIGFIALLVAANFLSQAYSISFTLFFAISASLKAITAGADSVGAHTQAEL